MGVARGWGAEANVSDRLWSWDFPLGPRNVLDLDNGGEHSATERLLMCYVNVTSVK